MKNPFHIFLLAALLILSPAAFGQTSTPKPGAQAVLMAYYVEGADTVYTDQIAPAYIWQRLPRQKGKEWREYYRLVHNFSKVYPYAKQAAAMIRTVDSTLAVTPMRNGQRDRYLMKVQDQLFKYYKKPLTSLTMKQGALLTKLIDRETGITSYDIIKTYRSKAAAGFWKGIAKMFEMDLAAPYDPQGEDALTEELVQVWERGDFECLYFSIFGKPMPVPQVREVPSKLK